jgi:Lipoprotein LpqB beta-propeller domain/Sporulation and spore germination
VSSRPTWRAAAVASRLRAAALGLLLAASLAGCVSMPSAGPVLSYAVTQGPGGQAQPYYQSIPQSPGRNWTPSQIVQGFLTAAASFGSSQQVAREYLTPEFSKHWKPDWSAIVFSKGPTVASVAVPAGSSAATPTASPTAKPASSAKKSPPKPQTATVMVTGKVQANLLGSGSYAVPSASGGTVPVSFDLVKAADGQWRISDSSEPTLLLLTSYQFSIDYQQRNLYFFDPSLRVLVPDPVYAPLQATPADLMRQLVKDLIQPPKDWLFRATQTAFPLGTTVGAVTLDGTGATVNLGGALGKVPAKAAQQVMSQVSSQLLSTLTGTGQGGPAVKTVEVVVDGKPWVPLGAQGSAVQTTPQYTPPKPAKTGVFYYVDHAGYLVRQVGTQGKPLEVSRIGPGFTQIAVSPDGRYLAALRGSPQGGGTLFTGPVGGPLVKRGAAYNSMSWDPSDELWATSGDQVFVLRGQVSQGPQGQAVPVDVVNADGVPPGSFSGIRIAPDGVRVAIIVGTDLLNFGAIVPKVTDTAHPSVASDKIVLSPFYVAAPGTVFSEVTWYGPDNVITLSTPGPALTEYPVNGGSSTPIPPPPGIATITASLGWPLVAGVAKLGMMADESLAGVWSSIDKGVAPAYPG